MIPRINIIFNISIFFSNRKQFIKSIIFIINKMILFNVFINIFIIRFNEFYLRVII